MDFNGFWKAKGKLDQTAGLSGKISLVLRWVRKMLWNALYIQLMGEKRHIDAFYERLLWDRNFAQQFVSGHLRTDFQSKVVLDAGCGRGRATAALALLGVECVAIDLYEHEFWHRLSQPLFAIADIGSMPFRASWYDACVCLTVLTNVQDDKDTLKEIHRVLKPDGTLVLQVANTNNLKSAVTGRKLDPAHKRTYEKKQVESLVRELGFKVRLSNAIGFYSPFLTRFINDLMTQKMWLFMGALLPEKYRGVLLIVCEKL